MWGGEFNGYDVYKESEGKGPKQKRETQSKGKRKHN